MIIYILQYTHISHMCDCYAHALMHMTELISPGLTHKFNTKPHLPSPKNWNDSVVVNTHLISALRGKEEFNFTEHNIT